MTQPSAKFAPTIHPLAAGQQAWAATFLPIRIVHRRRLQVCGPQVIRHQFGVADEHLQVTMSHQFL